MPDEPAPLLVAELIAALLVELAPVLAADFDEVDELAPGMVLFDMVADFALAVDDADIAEVILEAIEEVAAIEEEAADETEEADEEADAIVMLLVADALALGVIDSTVFELSTTKGAL